MFLNGLANNTVATKNIHFVRLENSALNCPLFPHIAAPPSLSFDYSHLYPTLAHRRSTFADMTTYYCHNIEEALKRAKAAGKKPGCRYCGIILKNGKRGFAIYKDGIVVISLITRRKARIALRMKLGFIRQGFWGLQNEEPRRKRGSSLFHNASWFFLYYKELFDTFVMDYISLKI